MELITGKLNIKKIREENLFTAESGAVYLDIVLVPTPDNKYGDDYMIVQSATKEERANGKKGEILGNAKIFVKQGGDNKPLPTFAEKANDDSPF